MDTITSETAGWQRFDYFLQQVQAALTKAEATENPGLSLYQQNVRTPIFMLEALSRVYSYINNKKLFEKLDKRFINRPSRFDIVKKIGMPSELARRQYLSAKSPRLAADDGAGELTEWVKLTNGFSIAHLRIIHRATP